MSSFTSLILMVIFIGGILVFLELQPKTGFTTTSMKMRRAATSQWSLTDFLKLKPSRWKLDQYFFFSEEKVRSHSHRYAGRLDGAILHWKTAPILDLVIEYKFPTNRLPRRVKEEDMFQAGLYALALLESGVSCSTTKLVTVYCLQDTARRCLDRKSARECWRCGKGRTFVTKFKQRDVEKKLERLDEVWYGGRKPVPTQDVVNCRVCPYSKGKCNYSLV